MSSTEKQTLIKCTQQLEGASQFQKNAKYIDFLNRSEGMVMFGIEVYSKDQRIWDMLGKKIGLPT